MSDTTISPDAAVEQLQALEQAIEDGQQVTPAELEAAHAAVKHANLFERGRRKRAERAAAKAAAKVREQAKADAAKLLGDGDTTTAILTAFDQARAAVENLVAAVEDHDAKVQQAVQVLAAGGVPEWFNAAAFADVVASVEHFDPNNHAIGSMGVPASSVVSNGVRHSSQDSDVWVRSLLGKIADDHDSYTLREASEGLRGWFGYAPTLLKDHLAAQAK